MAIRRPRGPWVSVVVNNFNYGDYLAEAVDSALAQSYPATEVVVVDDGSTDGSRATIAGYGDRVVSVLKENGGQASAFNAGFAASRGEIVVFLDADDVLLPRAVETAVSAFDSPEVVKVHWPLWIVDRHGKRAGPAHPAGLLPEGDLREDALRRGPTTHIAPPTSGNAWSRRFLERVLPVPESIYRISADKYLLEAAPFMGEIRRVRAPQGLYRIHDRNSQRVTTVDERLDHELRLYDDYSQLVRRHCEAQGQAVDLGAWKQNSWWHRQRQALNDIASLPAGTGTVLLVDQGAWGPGPVAGRSRCSGLAGTGESWISPADDETAIRELERMRDAGAGMLVFVWSTFWWLEHYRALRRHLRASYRCLVENERIVAFDLRTRRTRGNAARMKEESRP